MADTSRRRLLAQATTLAAGVGFGPHVLAQTTPPFPSRPIRILVGFAAGGDRRQRPYRGGHPGQGAT